VSLVALTACGTSTNAAAPKPMTVTQPATTIAPAAKAARLKDFDVSAIRTMIEAENTAYRMGSRYRIRR